MKFVEQDVEMINPPLEWNAYATIETAGRACYQSEGKEEDREDFIRRLIKRGHESVLEHVSITMRLITSRAIANQIVRHRIAAYSQESTRYCNYAGGQMEYILPLTEDKDRFKYQFGGVLKAIEQAYNEGIETGFSPEEMRDLLPLGLKTELVATMNVRQWRHVLKQRLQKAAHPQIRALMEMVLWELNDQYPVLFGDIYENLEDIENL